MVVYLIYISDKNQCVKHLVWQNKLNDKTPGRTASSSFIDPKCHSLVADFLIVCLRRACNIPYTTVARLL
jgi:hypothetical protein